MARDYAENGYHRPASSTRSVMRSDAQVLSAYSASVINPEMNIKRHTLQLKHPLSFKHYLQWSISAGMVVQTVLGYGQLPESNSRSQLPEPTVGTNFLYQRSAPTVHIRAPISLTGKMSLRRNALSQVVLPISERQLDNLRKCPRSWGI